MTFEVLISKCKQKEICLKCPYGYICYLIASGCVNKEILQEKLSLNLNSYTPEEQINQFINFLLKENK